MALLRPALSLVVVTCVLGCRPAHSPQKVGCRSIGTDTSDSAVKGLYAANRAPLVVTERAVYLCECGGRKLGGAEEQAKLGGGTEANRLGGKVEENKLAGTTEVGKTGGATEKGQLAGATEAGKTGGGTEQGQMGGAVEHGQNDGAMEQGKLGGAVEPLTCSERPSCLGFVVSGGGPVRVYASTGWADAPDRCVME